MKMSIADYRKVINIKSEGSKYSNQITIYKGERYHSKREADYAASLDTLLSARVEAQRVLKYERQVKYRLDVNDVHIANYLLDFKVWYADGRIEHVDVKGVSTAVYKMKKKLMLALHGINIIET